MELTVAQCRAGRALLGWSMGELATASGLGVMTVNRFEGGQTVAAASIAKMAKTLNDAGVVLIGDGEASASGRAGVRLV